MKPDKPSDLELQILGVLWRHGPATARDVLTAMPDGKKRAYTSVLSAMQVMEKKGLLTRSREGLTDRWRPAVSKSRVLGPFLRNLVANVFGGQSAQVMQHLLQETDVDEAELAAIRELLDARQVQQRGAKQKGKHP
jgi:BlaI family penicillinase repressor